MSCCTFAFGAGVTKLTKMITAKPTGTPNTPAEIGKMPYHRSTGLVTPKMLRIHA